MFDAPRWADPSPGSSWHGTLPAPRLRLGGTGTPGYEALAYAPRLPRGVPVVWVTEWHVAYYNGRAFDIHGDPIGTEYSEGHFPYEAIDPDDPPLFESEPAYLRRLGFLGQEEEAALEPSAFDPVPVDHQLITEHSR